MDSGYAYGGIVMTAGLETIGLSITTNGFTVKQSGNANCNFISNGYPTTYRYLAFFN